MADDQSVTGKQWQLRTSSWVGQSIGAQHYYAELNSSGPGRNWRVEREMTPQDIVKLNRARRDMGLRLEDYRPGEWCNGFDSLDDAVFAGMAVWDAIASPGDSLVHYTSVDCELGYRGELLCGPEGNEYVYDGGTFASRRAAVVKRTATGWNFVELEED